MLKEMVKKHIRIEVEIIEDDVRDEWESLVGMVEEFDETRQPVKGRWASTSLRAGTPSWSKSAMSETSEHYLTDVFEQVCDKLRKSPKKRHLNAEREVLLNQAIEEQAEKVKLYLLQYVADRFKGALREMIDQYDETRQSVRSRWAFTKAPVPSTDSAWKKK